MRALLTSLLFLISAIPALPVMAKSEESDRYESDCYECRSEPFSACSWGVQFTAGVRPIIWKQRGMFYTLNPIATTCLNDVAELPKFFSLYHVPYQIGGQVSRALTNNIMIFAEFNYANASPKALKGDHQALLDDSGLAFARLSDYRLYDGYAGARYYWDRWCDRYAIYIGGKVGFLVHQPVRVGFMPTPGVLTYPDYQQGNYGLFRKNVVFAGSGHIGVDVCLGNNWSFVATGEVVVNSGPWGVQVVNPTSYDALILNNASQIVMPGAEKEVSFPITFGFKYYY